MGKTNIRRIGGKQKLSLSWRELVKRKRKQIQEQMKLSDTEMDFVFENMGEFCRESDGQIRLVYGENCNVDKVVDNMSENEVMQMTKEVIREVLERLKAKKKKKEIQKTEETESEENNNEENEANELEDEDQEIEVENK